MIDPSLKAVLRSRYTIRRFFLLYCAILVLVLLALWAVTASLETGSVLRAISADFLGPLGAEDRPSSVVEAVAAYRDGRAEAERRFGCRVSRNLEAEVISVVM